MSTTWCSVLSVSVFDVELFIDDIDRDPTRDGECPREGTNNLLDPSGFNDPFLVDSGDVHACV